MSDMAAVSGKRNAGAGLKGRAVELTEKIRQFIVYRVDYYLEQFNNIESYVRFPLTFNWSATALGSIWYIYRRIYSPFWVLLFLETVAIVYISCGAFGNLGGADFARAEQLRLLATQRVHDARQLDPRDPSIVGLMESSKALQAAADAAAERGAVAVRGRWKWLVAGAFVLVLAKASSGVLANWMLYRRFCRWQANLALKPGPGVSGAIGAALVATFVYGLACYKFLGFHIPQWIATVPASQVWHAATANGIDDLLDLVTVRGRSIFAGLTSSINALLFATDTILIGTPWPIIVVAIVAIAYMRAGRKGAIISILSISYICVLGYWKKSMETISILGTSAIISISIGMILGIICAKSRSIYNIIHPILSLMQTIPVFVYLIPAIAFFGIGKPPSVLASVVFAVPPMVHLTALGLMGISQGVREAGAAFGVSRRFVLFNIELPLAMPSIKTGASQTTLMCLSMVVVSALIGAKGLGEDVLTALGQVAAGDGILAGIAILCCALLLDCVIQGERPSATDRDK